MISRRHWQDLERVSFLRRLAGDWLVWILLAVSLATRFLYWWLIANHSPMDALLANPPDTRLYIGLANDLYNLRIVDENALYMTGFGYSAFITALLFVSGKSFYFVLSCQILLSAVSSVLLYAIGTSLTGKRAIGFVAGLIHAISITAIALSVSFLSETLFFFLLCLSVLVFIRIVRNPDGLDYIVLGLLLAYAVFTRSVAQFLPPLFLLVGLLATGSMPQGKRLLALKRIAGGVALSLILVATWAFRNYLVHETFVVAGTGPGAAVMYLGARVEADRSDGLNVFDFRNRYDKELGALNNGSATYKDKYDWYRSKLVQLFSDDPKSFVKTYLGIVKENILDFEHITELRLPGYEADVRKYMRIPQKDGLQYLMFLGAFAGLVILIVRRNMLAGLLLSGMYLYFAGISGFTFWQGSRILYPGQVSLAIFFGVGISAPFEWMYRRAHEPDPPKWLRRLQAISERLTQIVFYPNRFIRLSAERYRKLLFVAGFSSILMICVALVSELSRPPVYRQIDIPGSNHFSNSVVLAAARLEDDEWSTRAIIFRFYLQAKFEEKYRFYFHLYPLQADSVGMINRDFASRTPTFLWPTGQTITQRRLLELPPGTYSAELGFFNSDGRYGEPVTFPLSVK